MPQDPKSLSETKGSLFANCGNKILDVAYEIMRLRHWVSIICSAPDTGEHVLVTYEGELQWVTVCDLKTKIDLCV